jgi:hypothetical protein
LLEGLAYQTGGEYLFTNSGATLGSFFAACREAAVGKELADQISGILEVGGFLEVGRIEVDRDTCGFSLVLNHLSGSPSIELIGPEGDPVVPDDDEATYQIRNQVQLFTVEDPAIGEWIINLSNQAQAEEDAVFSLLISTSPCEEPREITEADTAVDLPFFLTVEAIPAATGIVVVIVVLLAGFTAFIILIRQRRSNK